MLDVSPYSMLRARRTSHTAKNHHLETDNDAFYPQPRGYSLFTAIKPPTSLDSLVETTMSATVTSASTPGFTAASPGRLTLSASPQASDIPQPKCQPKGKHRHENQPHKVTKDLKQSNFGNDFSTAFVTQGISPQTWVRNIEDPFKGYPKLQSLHTIKAKHLSSHSHAPIGIPTKGAIWGTPAGVGSKNKANSPKLENLPDSINEMQKQLAQFDVVMIHGCVDEWPQATFEQLNIDGISSRPSLLFFWVPSNQIDEGRSFMTKWGFRRGEDITFAVNSLDSPFAPRKTAWSRQSSLFTPTTWHCSMGLKGTSRRTSDTNLINCNVDTDVIIEQQNQRANIVPEQIYEIVENFTNMGRKSHIVPTHTPEKLPVRPRRGWVIVGPSVSPCGMFTPRKYQSRQLIPVHPEVEILRPQTPPGR